MIKIIVLVMAVFLAGCAPAPAARMSDAVPAAQPASASASTVSSPQYDFSNPSRSCKVDADCEVKDVGNCCGTHPECVNTNAPTNPAKVRAQCRAEHRTGMCNVRAIGGCSCVQGQCNDLNPGSAKR